jgi:L-amino acid N-acyltransferase YncA
MKLAFGWVPLRRFFAEPNIHDLLSATHLEAGIFREEIPLDPDYERMIAAELSGIYKMWAARDGTLLVGYLGFWIQPHIHYKSTLVAVDDVYYLSPAYRRGMTGVRFIASALDALRELEVRCCCMFSKTHFREDRDGLEKLFKRLGFSHTDNLYTLVL